MTESEATPGPNEINPDELLRSLRRKEGNWVGWGKACQQLQKAGYSPQTIFEETGFEPIQQNQVIVASQVYTSLVNGQAGANVLEHFQQRGSDSLYELRVLSPDDRIATAELLVEKGLDSEAAHELTRAVRDSRLVSLPAEFSEHPGDAVAYQCWKAARRTDDLQGRSRLIARGLSFAQSETARQQIEKLLTDFTVVKAQPAPRLPVYRLEAEEGLPRIVPLVGKLPLTKADLQAAPLVDEIGAFKLVKFAGEGAWVALPGWQVVATAEDPVAILSASEGLPTSLPGEPEEVLIVIDRAQRQWNADSYFVIKSADQLELQWFEVDPERSLLGRVILVMRPKRVFDQTASQDIWQLED